MFGSSQWEEADKKYADFMNRMEKKYGSEWESQQQGSVSKADIQKFLKDNRIEVVEVVKGENKGEGMWM